MSRLWLISYDIADDKIRRRVFNRLKDCGKPVQYSVFECHLDDAMLQALRQRLQAEIDVGDSVRWYPLCGWCCEKVSFQGVGLPPEDQRFFLL